MQSRGVRGLIRGGYIFILMRGTTIKVAAGSGRIWGFTLIYQVEEEKNLTTLFFDTLVFEGPLRKWLLHPTPRHAKCRGERRHPSFLVGRAPATASHPPNQTPTSPDHPVQHDSVRHDPSHPDKLSGAERSPASKLAGQDKTNVQRNCLVRPPAPETMDALWHEWSSHWCDGRLLRA